MESWHAFYVSFRRWSASYHHSLHLAAEEKLDLGSGWCLLVFFVPVLGSLLFLIFGYQQIHRPLWRKQRHKKRFQMSNPRASLVARDTRLTTDASWEEVARLARRFGAFPVKSGSQVCFYYEGQPAFDDKMQASRASIFVNVICQQDSGGITKPAGLRALGVKSTATGCVLPQNRWLGADRGGRKCTVLPLSTPSDGIRSTCATIADLVVDGEWPSAA